MNRMNAAIKVAAAKVTVRWRAIIKNEADVAKAISISKRSSKTAGFAKDLNGAKRNNIGSKWSLKSLISRTLNHGFKFFNEI